MNDTKCVDRFCQQPFLIELRKKGDTYILWHREFNLIESDHDLKRAYEKLESSLRETCIRLLEIVEDESELPKIARLSSYSLQSDSIRSQLIKASIMSFFLALIAWLCVPAFLDKLAGDIAKNQRRESVRICDDLVTRSLFHFERLRQWAATHPDEFRSLVAQFQPQSLPRPKANDAGAHGWPETGDRREASPK